VINAFDQEELRCQVRCATPFPHFCLDSFFHPDFAEAVAGAFPSYDDAQKVGRTFSTVNERKKVQVTDSGEFAAPITGLNRMLAAPSFLGQLSYVFDIPNLLADDRLFGGGIHEMAPVSTCTSISITPNQAHRANPASASAGFPRQVQSFPD
jgi:hypothetical protein